MAEKIVEAYSEDDLIASYPINLVHVNFPITDEDFIREAKECHSEDGLSVSLIDKWVVRDAS